MSSSGEMIFDARMNASDFEKDASKLGNIVKGLSVFEVIKKGMSMVAQSIDAAVSRYDTLTRFSPIMQQMGYSAQDADASISKLSKGIQGLPTTLDGIVANTRQLAIATGSLDKGTDAALALNNAFLASGVSAEDASRGTTQYIQALSSGKMQQQEWYTLTQTMTCALQEVAKAFGYTGTNAVDQLGAALKSGEITMTQFNDKIIELGSGIGGFAEVAKTATGGIGTAMTNLKTRTVMGVTSIIEAIDRGFSQTRFKSIENIINTTSTGIKNGLQSVAKVAEFTAKNFDVLAPAVLGVAVAFKAYSVIGAVTTSFKSMQVAVATANTILSAATLTAGKATAMSTAYSAAMASETTAELVRTAAKKAGMSIDAAGNLVTAQSTAAKAAETATVLANSGALTAKTVITGVLTGQIGLVTAAQWLWNAAMAANPVGAVVVVVLALVAAVAAVIAIFHKESEETKQLHENIERLEEKHDSLKESMDEAEAAAEDETRALDVQAKSANGLISDIKGLVDANGRAGDNAMLVKAKIDQLNGVLGESVVSYNETTGEVEGLTDALVEQQQAEARASVQKQKYNSLLESQAEASINLEDINRQLALVMEDNAHIQYEMYDYLGNAIPVYTQEYNDLLALQTEATALYDETTTAVEGMSGAMEQIYADEEAARMEAHNADVAALAEQYGVSAASIQSELDAQGVSLDEWATAAEASAQRQQEALATYTEAATNMFDRIETESEQSVQSMIDNLKHNQQAVADWSDNLVLLAEKGVDQGLLQQLRDAGPESAATVAAMVAASDEELAELSSVFADGADVATQALMTELGLPEVANAGSEMVTELAGGVTANESLTEATVQMVTNARAALEENVAASDFGSIGQKIAAEIVNGVKNSDMSGITSALTSSVQTGASSVNAALNTMKAQMASQFTAMKTASTTTVTQMMTSVVSGITTRQGAAKSAAQGVSTGVITEFESMKNKAKTVVEQMMTAVVTAIKNGTESAKSAASSVVDAIVSAINAKGTDAHNAGKNIGQQMANGMVAGLEAGKGAVYSKADEIANEAARRIKAALQVKSPSRVMEDIFQNVVLGMIVGMEDEENGLFRAVDILAEGVVERLRIIPEGMAAALNNKLRLAVASNQEVFAKIPAVAAAGEGVVSNTFNYSFYQTINSDKYMSPADNARAAEALLRKIGHQIK